MLYYWKPKVTIVSAWPLFIYSNVQFAYLIRMNIMEFLDSRYITPVSKLIYFLYFFFIRIYICSIGVRSCAGINCVTVESIWTKWNNFEHFLSCQYSSVMTGQPGPNIFRQNSTLLERLFSMEYFGNPIKILNFYAPSYYIQFKYPFDLSW